MPLGSWKLILATRNLHKVEELRHLLAELSVDVRSLAEYPAAPEVEESAPDFEGNALLKARAASRATGEWVLADDSGLEVDALGGRPGVLSNRYAGVAGDSERNNALLLRELADVPDGRRTARFVCVAALAAPDGRAWTFRGTCEGRIGRAPRGARGFGYDPLFLLPDREISFAELDLAAKNLLSHRGAALAKVRERMTSLRAEMAHAHPGVRPA
ncbi:MAG: RdgB/HAM1 family non-canonical purine NTP pyrophosphatase [Planctomycetes bacterium]|nr:RdgB/HAM1 family non-canonical purine NTP pyrophosphatase [Planctomycetota bacterium]